MKRIYYKTCINCNFVASSDRGDDPQLEQAWVAHLSGSLPPHIAWSYSTTEVTGPDVMWKISFNADTAVECGRCRNGFVCQHQRGK